MTDARPRTDHARPHSDPPWDVAARTGAYWLDDRLYGTNGASVGRYGLWLVVVDVLLLLAAWTLGAPGPETTVAGTTVSLWLLAALGIAGFGLATVGAARGAGLLAAFWSGLTPALAYPTAALAAAVFELGAPAGVERPAFLLALAAGGALAGALGYAVAQGYRAGRDADVGAD